MALLTAAQIAAALDAFAFTIPLKEINGYVVQDVSRRLYPSIDVANVTGQENLVDVPTTNTKQIYKVILYYRIVGFGNLDEPDIKTLENEIFEVIDGLQDTSTKITISESWKREPSVEGTTHVKSTLTVQTDEISSTSGDGIRGDQITITFPNSIGTFDVIDVITDQIGIIKDLDLENEGDRIFTKISRDDLLIVSIAVDIDTENQIAGLVAAGTDVVIFLARGGSSDARTVNFTSIVASGTRGEIETQIVSMDVIG